MREDTYGMKDNFSKFLDNKKLIIFGTGKAGVDITNKIGVELISYYIDNNKNKQGKIFMGKPIFSPDALFQEKKGKVYILIASMYYKEIGQQLMDMGYIEKSDFDYDYMIEFIWSNYTCLCCGGNYNQLLPYGIMTRENALCPGCNSLERHRFLWDFISENKELFQEKINILHVAPEKILQRKLQALPNVNYISVDLDSQLAMLKVDITDICFKDNYFNLIICNHVLEHITNDMKAMMELYRVLSPNGLACIMVPINKRLKNTYEDDSIITYEERLEKFGQGDHVRIYGMDFIERLKETGFTVSIYSVAEHYSDEQIKKYGLIKDDEIFLCRKENR